MKSFKIHTKKPDQERLYIFHIKFDSGMEVVKIGKSSGDNSVDRMLQIQRDYFMRNRCTFICKIKRDRVVPENVFQYETVLHHFFKDYQYTPKSSFDGSSELFAIPLDAAVDVYEYLLENGLDSLDGMEFDPSNYYEEEDQLPF